MWPSAASRTTTVQPERPSRAAAAWSSRLQRASVACTARSRSTAPSVGGSRGQARGDQLAGMVAALVPAHAVGHHPQAALRQGGGAVLVELADMADMAAHGRAEGDHAAGLRPATGGESRRPAWPRRRRAGAGPRRRAGWAARRGEPRPHHRLPIAASPASDASRVRREAAAARAGRQPRAGSGFGELVQARFELLQAQLVPQRGQGQFFDADRTTRCAAQGSVAGGGAPRAGTPARSG